jgi:catechol 2,3-dioxygenase-like lactoylglutathione lyase family enzyme
MLPDTADLFAGVPVTDRARAVEWYERLLGKAPSFLPNDKEAVWQLAEHRYLFIEVNPQHAGHARHLLFIGDFEAVMAQIAQRGLEPFERETLPNGVRKASYRDPDGNRLEFGGNPTQG